MTKSSCAAALLMTGWSAGATAAPPPEGWVTAEEAMRHYHETYGVRVDASSDGACPRTAPGADEDIVVCGPAPRRAYRLPLPIEREPGEIVRHINEPRSGVGAMSAPCFRGCDASGVDVLKVVSAVPKIIGHILGNDD